MVAELLLKILLPSTIFSTTLLFDLRKSSNTHNNLMILARTIILCALTTGFLCAVIYHFYGLILFSWLKIEIVWVDKYFLLMIGGVFLNAMAAILSAYIEASGRQGLRFAVFIGYVPIYLYALSWLIPLFGVNGAAMGWMLKGTMEVLMFGAAVTWLFKSVK